MCRACRIEIGISALQRTLAERTLNEYNGGEKMKEWLRDVLSKRREYEDLERRMEELQVRHAELWKQCEKVKADTRMAIADNELLKVRCSALSEHCAAAYRTLGETGARIKE